MSFARVNGVELYDEVHGPGDWLVLSHEFAGGSLAFSKLGFGMLR